MAEKAKKGRKPTKAKLLELFYLELRDFMVDETQGIGTFKSKIQKALKRLPTPNEKRLLERMLALEENFEWGPPEVEEEK